MKTVMIRMFFMLLLVLALLSTSACGSSTEINNTETILETESSNATEEITDIDDQGTTPSEVPENIVNNCMDIAKYDWGTSRTVIRNENITDDMVAGTNYGEYEHELVLDTIILGYFMGVHYEFDSNETLVSTMYVMAEDSSDETYVKAFLELLDAYQQELGDYKSVTDPSGLSRVIADPASYAAELTKDDSVMVQWGDDLNDSMLVLTLSGQQGYADVIVLYTCPGYYKN